MYKCVYTNIGHAVLGMLRQAYPMCTKYTLQDNLGGRVSRIERNSRKISRKLFTNETQ